MGQTEWEDDHKDLQKMLRWLLFLQIEILTYREFPAMIHATVHMITFQFVIRVFMLSLGYCYRIE